MSTATTSPAHILRMIDPEAIRDELAELQARQKELRLLLRASMVRHRTRVPRANAGAAARRSDRDATQ
jgi:hypothetical protein